jgi:exopolyphosphatase/guanosine-5'-triphosphate,3'-diphosphate pyrophosphatase
MGTRVSRPFTGLADARRLAVVDLGSNTFRLVVFQYHPGEGPFRLTDEIREPVRLTAGEASSGRLSDAAIGRAWRTARLFAAYCREARIDEVIALATSAVREAGNRGEALAALSDGLPVRVISGEEEARYAYLGAVNSTTLADGLTMEIGGGSVQVGQVRGRELVRSASEALGAVRMTEAYLPGARTTRPQVKALRRHVAERLGRHDWIGGAGRLVGMGGSVRTLAAMVQKAVGYPLGEVHGFMLTREAVSEAVERMIPVPVAERNRIPGLKTDRADIMLAAAVVIGGVMDAAGVDRLEVCAQGLRWGAFYERFIAGADPPLLADVRRDHVLNTARIYGHDPTHCDQVARLALQMFDGLAALGLHGADPREREWLWAAAMLHDVGVLVDYNDHHKHSHYLVLNAGLPGFRHRELAMIAMLVRAHRKAIAGPGDLAPLLKPGDDERLLRLAACLRTAEQLERGRAELVRGVECAAANGRVELKVTVEGDPGVALWSAEQEREVFQRAFGRDLAVSAR